MRLGHTDDVEFLKTLFSGDVRRFFIAGQLAFVLFLVYMLWRFFSGAHRSGTGSLSDDSSFGFRESDRKRRSGASVSGDQLADAKLKQNAAGAGALRLGGIQIHGQPHEILGVHPLASEETIQKAYRERMKQYHPDKVARPGTEQWHEAQKIAEAINRARVEMLKKATKSG